MVERKKSILNTIRNDPLGARSLASAISHANHFYGGPKEGARVQTAIIRHIDREHEGCPESYLNSIKKDPNTPLYSYAKEIIGIFD